MKADGVRVTRPLARDLAVDRNSSPLPIMGRNDCAKSYPVQRVAFEALRDEARALLHQPIAAGGRMIRARMANGTSNANTVRTARRRV